MSDGERIRRPVPDRTEPVRNWSTLFRPPDRDGESPPVRSIEDAVSRSVELGYRVVEEYVRHGQQVAARVGARAQTPDAVMADAGELGARMAQYASDLVATWFQLVESTAANGREPARPAAGVAADDGAAADGAAAGGVAPGGVAPGGVAPAPAAGAGPRVVVSLAATRPTEVTVEIRAGARADRLVAHALRAAAPDAPRIDAPAIAAGADGVTHVRVAVPAEHPPGTYSGLVIDAGTSRPMGSISVRVG